MFTQTVRALECGGLVKREIFAVVPQRVEYEELIISLIMQIGYWRKSIGEHEEQ